MSNKINPKELFGHSCSTLIDNVEQWKKANDGECVAVNSELVARSNENMRTSKTDDVEYLTGLWDTINGSGLQSLPTGKLEEQANQDNEKRMVIGIVAGYGRTSAMVKIGQCRYVPVQKNEQYSIRDSIIENLHRKNPTTSEYKSAVVSLYEGKMSINQIAKAIGKSESWVLSVLGITGFLSKPENNELKELFDKDKLAVPTAQKLLNQRNNLTPEIRKKIVSAVRAKKPQTEIVSLIIHETDAVRQSKKESGGSVKKPVEIVPKFDRDRMSECLKKALKAKEKAGKSGAISAEHEIILYVHHFTDVDISERKKEIPVDVK